MENQISVVNIPEISAIYFALLQCGYDYYTFEKDVLLVESIEKFYLANEFIDTSFFSEVRQSTCEVYPYWPRAATLETATFFLDSAHNRFKDFDAYHKHVMAAGNLSDVERNHVFWQWVEEFPSALRKVLCSKEFQTYLIWENDWIRLQNRLLQNELLNIQRVITTCKKGYSSPIEKVSVVLNPIKCAYSADYHIFGNQLYFCSGAFQPESVIHEFLHHVAHPLITEYRDAILQNHKEYPDIDKSYYLTGDDYGRLNAFEEYLVRKLTAVALADQQPFEIGLFIDEILHQ